jgi:hypothetical protein
MCDDDRSVQSRTAFADLNTRQVEEVFWKTETLGMSPFLQGDKKVSVHLMIKIQKVTSNVQSVPRQSPDID